MDKGCNCASYDCNCWKPNKLTNHPISEKEKYLKLVDFVKRIIKYDCHHEFYQMKAKELLKEIGEL